MKKLILVLICAFAASSASAVEFKSAKCKGWDLDGFGQKISIKIQRLGGTYAKVTIKDGFQPRKLRVELGEQAISAGESMFSAPVGPTNGMVHFAVKKGEKESVGMYKSSHFGHEVKLACHVK